MAGCLDLFHLLNYDRWMMVTAEFSGRACVWTPCLYGELPINNCLHLSPSDSVTLHNCDKGESDTALVPPYGVWRELQSTCQWSKTVSTNLQYVGFLSKLSKQLSPLTPREKQCFWLHNHLVLGKEFSTKYRNFTHHVSCFL